LGDVAFFNTWVVADVLVAAPLVVAAYCHALMH
jgi:hypothetical protein